MPASDVHRDQALRNRTFAYQPFALGEDGSDPTALQWAVTAAFYCALHCVELHLSDRRVHSLSHWDGEQYLDSLPDPIYTAYKQLKSFSESCRYYATIYETEFVRRTVLERYLERIVRWAGLP